jgi:hypothetical protein
MRIGELDIECHEDEFGYWAKQQRTGSSGRNRKGTP